MTWVLAGATGRGGAGPAVGPHVPVSARPHACSRLQSGAHTCPTTHTCTPHFTYGKVKRGEGRVTEGHGGSRTRRGGRTLACRGSSGKARIFPPSGRSAVFTLHFPVKLSKATAPGAGARVAFFAGEPGSRALTHGRPSCRRAPPAPLGPSWQVKGASAPAAPGIWLQSERPPSAPGALRRLLRAAALAAPCPQHTRVPPRVPV